MSSTAVKMLIHYIPGPIPGPTVVIALQSRYSSTLYSFIIALLLLLTGV